MNYRIRVKIEMSECNDAQSEHMTNPAAGIYEQVISREVGESIDDCEQKLLVMSYEAMRASLSVHLSQASQKAAEQLRGAGEDVISKQYRVDGEVGRIEFEAYYVDRVAGLQGMLPILKGKDRYKSQGFKEVALGHGTIENSYNKSSSQLNRIRHQAGATPARTLRDNSEAEGQALQQALSEQTKETLKAHQFNPDGKPTDPVDRYRHRKLQTLPTQTVKEAIAQIAPDKQWQTKMANNKVPYEKPEQSLSICVDDVNTKRQKDTRSRQDESSQGEQADGPKYVHNTVAHIAQGQKAYIINGHGLVCVMKMVLAFLLHNKLLHFDLIFLVDGQRSLYLAIGQAFAWFNPFQFILDWYHLDKRCKEYLSMGLNGRHIRNDCLALLMPFLWHGCLEDAIALLEHIAPADIKNQDYVDKLIGYFERNRAYIPCYSVRKQLKLPNSTSQGEKANDLIVSQRQKHNGMSWSVSGSVALATLSALVRNGEATNWFRSRSLDFCFPAVS